MFLDARRPAWSPKHDVVEIMGPDLPARKRRIVVNCGLRFRQPKHGPHRFLVFVGHVPDVIRDADYLERSGILDLAGPEVLPDGILVPEESSRKGLVDHGHLARRGTVL